MDALISFLILAIVINWIIKKTSKGERSLITIFEKFKEKTKKEKIKYGKQIYEDYIGGFALALLILYIIMNYL